MDPFHRAVKNNELDMVRRFLLRPESRIALSHKDSDGRTALHWAAYCGNFEMAKLLLDSGSNILEKANDGKTALHIVTANPNCLEMIELMVRSGSDLSEKDNVGFTALHYASNRDYGDMSFEIVKFLVESGAKIDGLTDEDVSTIDVTRPGPVRDYLIKELDIQKNGGYVLK